MRWPQERSAEALDGLLALYRAAMRSTGGASLPGVVSELIEALQADAEGMFATEPAEGAPGIVDGVTRMVTPSQAAEEVGMSAVHVRRLCSGGLVRHQLVGAGRYLLDLDDLRAHLSGRAS